MFPTQLTRGPHRLSFDVLRPQTLDGGFFSGACPSVSRQGWLHGHRVRRSRQ